MCEIHKILKEALIVLLKELSAANNHIRNYQCQIYEACGGVNHSPKDLLKGKAKLVNKNVSEIQEFI